MKEIKKKTGQNPWSKSKSKQDVLYTPSTQSEERRQRGRPTEHEERWTKVTVVLFDSQIAQLDHLAADIRIKTGAALSRAELVRFMIKAGLESGVDLTDITSEEEGFKKLTAHLKKC